MFDCSTLKITYQDSMPLSEHGIFYLTEDGNHAEEGSVSTHSNRGNHEMLVCVTCRSERDVVLPSIPLSLHKYCEFNGQKDLECTAY